jgi:hypothetical protein
MRNLTGLPDGPGDDRRSPSPSPSPEIEPGGSLRQTTRRSLLAFGGLLASGTTALAADGETRRASRSAEARLKLARAALDTVRTHIDRGQYKPGERDPIYIWSRRRQEARLDLSAARDERVAAAQEHLDEMRAAEQIVSRLYATGAIDFLAKMDAEYRRMEAESWLEQEQAKALPPASMRHGLERARATPAAARRADACPARRANGQP